MMRKRTKVLVTILALLAVLTALAVWQRDNLRALRYGMTLDGDTLDQRVQETQETLDGAMEEFDVNAYEFTEEELSALADGSLGVEEAAQKLLEPAPSAGEDDPAGSSPEGTAQSSPEEEQIRACIAEMYVLQATYEGKLDALVQSVIDEYNSGELTRERKQKLMTQRIGEVLELEKECNAGVSEVTNRLRSLLKAAGRDDSLAKRVEEAYQEQKDLKKAQYLQRFRGE